ncbi:MAG: sortase B protein-sorting domain-containing protein, partial [Clostridium sp.]|nr:sortase B protein-sorting domain-containing protein [Clostridium sp.]
GAGADEVIVTITGGNVKAYGAESAEDIMEGGAGIGSGSNAKDITKETKYMVDTDTDIEITGGNILAVGGWGAAGIGSGANNVMADTISVSGADVEAYADGTKFAIDTRLLLEDGMTESREDGRNVDGNIFQGTFVHRYTHTCDDEEVTENAEGLRSFDIIGNDSGSIRTLTGMPAKYRSFAATVKSAGLHSVYTREASIGNGNGRYFGTTAKDIWAAEEMNETDVEYTVTGSALSDNFYLCPVTAAPAERIREEEQEVETPAEEVKQEEIPEETPVEEVKQEEIPEVKPAEEVKQEEIPEVKPEEAPKAAPAAEEAKQAEAPKAETPAEKTAKAEAPAAKADRKADANETVTKAAEPHTTVLYSTNLNEQEESIPEGEVLGAAREIVNETRGTVRRGGNEKAVLGAARGMTATGDSSMMVLWAVMMMTAAAGLLTLIRRRRAAR